MFNFFSPVSALFIIALSVWPGWQVKAAPQSQTFEKKIANLIRANQNVFDIGISVAATDGSFAYKFNSDKSLVPASILKIYTVAAALSELGVDFKTRTSVYTEQEPDSFGTIAGNLILYGRGDPNLFMNFDNGGTGSLFILADQLAARGLKNITGNIIADESYFDAHALGQGWDLNDLQWYYSAEVSALSLNANAVELQIKPAAKIGRSAELKITPQNNYVSLTNQTVTAQKGSKSSLKIHRSQGSNNILVSGRLPADYRPKIYRLSAHNPAFFTGLMFKTALEQRGIFVSGTVIPMNAAMRQAQPLNFNILKEMAFVESVPLSEEIKIINKQSSNFHAEILLRHLGIFYRGRTSISGTVEELGIQSIKEYLTQAGIDPGLLLIKDGSGLSKLDLVSADSTLLLLNYIRSQPYFQQFVDSLAINGIDGTLRNRLKIKDLKVAIKAKTGTTDQGNSLAGYASSKIGKDLIVAVIVNPKKAVSTAKAMALVDKIVALILSSSDE